VPYRESHPAWLRGNHLSTATLPPVEVEQREQQRSDGDTPAILAVAILPPSYPTFSFFRPKGWSCGRMNLNPCIHSSSTHGDADESFSISFGVGLW
jgi:hypothetical protein